jgi:predicted amidohydrolase YtcJ
MSAKAAFAAHARGGWRAVHRDDDGVLVPGASATFAIWDSIKLTNGLPTLEPGAPLPTCRRTVLRGATIYQES